MLALLHTAHTHVEPFGRLARELDEMIPIRHEVQEGLLAEVRAAGGITDAVRSAVADAVRILVGDGAQVIVCTCSTLGAVVEAAPAPGHVQVMRIDRAMAPEDGSRCARRSFAASLPGE